MAGRVMRWLHLTHRWLGVGLGLVVLLWCVSGVVMLFVARPQLTEAERLRALPALALQVPGVTPLAAWQALALPGWPEVVRVNRTAAGPTYHFLAGGRWWAVAATDGTPRPPVSAEEATAIAQNFRLATVAAGLSPSSAPASAVAGSPFRTKASEKTGEAVGASANATVVELTRDQWTVYKRFDAWRPFYRVEIDDAAGHAFYVSQRSGEVVLDSDAQERAWNWVGSVLHWLYFTPLRQMSELWRAVVLWLSFAALLLALGGLLLGIQRLRWRSPYPGGRVSPYRHGVKRWHHWAGIAGGVFVATWLFSGWLSLSPFGWLAGGASLSAEQKVLAGGPLDASVLAHWPAAAADPAVREIQWQRLGGAPYAVLLDGSGSRVQSLPAGEVTAFLPRADLIARARQLRPQAPLVAADWLDQADDNYYPLRHRPRSWPVLRLRFADAEHTLVYLNPTTAHIEARVDSASRWHRWLFGALHRLDFPPLATWTLGRDVAVIVLSALGVVICGAGCVLGWRRLRRPRQPVAGGAS
ncbi:PepSY domain-containing protein [Rhodocyclus gracilis]|uniref:PepSY domain-containing protein n=1 Tax=Rhodocyclus gracilis TaxID=2929842 RepID=UPI0030F49D86